MNGGTKGQSLRGASWLTVVVLEGIGKLYRVAAIQNLGLGEGNAAWAVGERRALGRVGDSGLGGGHRREQYHRFRSWGWRRCRGRVRDEEKGKKQGGREPHG